jgi:uncharacterized repeat protein (TIGR01451 family)
MIRKALLSAAVISAVVGLASAQQQYDNSYHPTLGSRLNALRRNLLGDGEQTGAYSSQMQQQPPTANGFNAPATRQSRYAAPPENDDSDASPPATVRQTAAKQTTAKQTTATKQVTSKPAAAPRPAATPRTTDKPKLFDTGKPLVSEEPPTPPADEESAEASDVASDQAMPSSRRRPQATPPAMHEVRHGAPAPAFDENEENVAPPAPAKARSTTTAAKPLTPAAPLAPAAPFARTARTEKSSPSLFAPASEPVAAPAEHDSSDQVLIARKSPNISVETAGPRRITVGKEATYLISVANSGEVAANDVVVHVDIPSWAEVLGAQASSGSTGVSTERSSEGYQWRISSLAARSRQELSLRLVPRKSQAFELGLRWTCSPIESQATVEVEEPKLEMAISGPNEVVYGEQQVYKLTISNPGTGDADGVTVHLIPINPGEGTTATHRVGTLPAGASKTVEIELTARQAGRISIKAEATAEGDLKANATEEVLVRRAQLQVAIVGPKVHYAGTSANYELRVKNPGDAPAEDLNLAALLPTEVSGVTATDDGLFESDENRIVWSLASLAPGQEVAYRFKFVMKSTGANRIEGVATAAGDLKDSNLVNTQVMALADLVLEVSDSPGPIPVGDEVIYEVQLRNRGTGAAEEVEIVASFSNGLEPLSVEGGRYEISSGSVVFKPIASLAAGSEALFKIHGRAKTAGNHAIRVELECKSLGTRLSREDSTLFYSEDGASAATPTTSKGNTGRLRPVSNE